jgi:hypothetical protein
LKCLPIFRLWNFLRGMPTEQRAGAAITHIFSVSLI